MTEIGILREYFNHQRERVLALGAKHPMMVQLDEVYNTVDEKPLDTLSYDDYMLYYNKGERISFEAKYFARRKQLAVYGLFAWLYEDDNAIKKLHEVIFSICNEYSWSLPAHMPFDEPLTIDLFSTQTAHTLLEICFLLKEKLDPRLLNLCEVEVQRRVMDLYIGAKEPFSFERMKNNWSAVCAAGIGMSAFYLLEEKVALKVYEKLRISLDNFLESFESDGACLEGLSYWTYGVYHYVAYGDMLHLLTDGKIDLFANSHFEHIAKFQEKCYMTPHCTLSFADGERHDLYRIGLARYLKRLYKEVIIPPKDRSANLYDDHCWRWIYLLRDLVWWEEEKVKDIPSKAPSGYKLPEAGWLLVPRNDTYGLAVQCGHNDVPHNHNDVGNFIVYKEDRDIVVDLGAGEYTADYFSDGRYTIFCNRSIAHNVPIVDGVEQSAGKQWSGVVEQMTEDAMTMDIAGAYDIHELLHLRRQLKIDHAKGIFLQDEFELLHSGLEIRERFITLIQPKIKGQEVLIGEEGSIKCLLKDQPDSIEVTEYEHRDHSGNKVTVYAIDFVLCMENKVVRTSFLIQ